MQLDELRSIARGLPIGSGDQCRDVKTLCAAVGVYCGKLTAIVGDSSHTSLPDHQRAELSRNLGASILVLVAIAEGQSLNLTESVRAGQKELSCTE